MSSNKKSPVREVFLAPAGEADATPKKKAAPKKKAPVPKKKAAPVPKKKAAPAPKKKATNADGSQFARSLPVRPRLAPKPKVVKERIITAKKGETVDVKKLVIGANERVCVVHSGGSLSIGEVTVRKGGEFVHDFAKAPKGFVIGKVNGAGQSTLRF